MLSNKIKYSLIASVILVFVGICWYAYFSQVETVPEQDLPLIKAQENIREKPTDPGGMEVMNKDKAIYKHMFNDKSIDSKIKIVDSQEKPASRESLGTLIDAQIKTGKRSKAKSVLSEEVVKPKVEEVKKIEDITKVEEVKAQPKPQAVVVKHYAIRVARLKDQNTFAEVSKMFREKYSVISGLTPKVTGDGSNYYLDFSVANKEKAESVCKALAEHGQKCKVID